MPIRPLDPTRDRALVDAFFQSAADYIRLERDADPDAEVTEAFFTDAPPGCDPAISHRVGLFTDTLTGPNLEGIAEMSFGFPAATDAYIGLMVIAAAARGSGAGQTLLRHLEATARAQGASHLYLGVLAANRRGHAFWTREGFTMALANRPVTIGQKTQLAHRLGKPL